MKKKEILNRIKDLDTLIDQEYMREQAYKLFLNASYGAFGSEFYYFYNRFIAESITSQGKDVNLLAEKSLNNYFKTLWADDKELHNKLGIIGEVKNVDSNINLAKYLHTDSNYFSLQEVFDTIDNSLNSTIFEDTLNFIIKLNDVFLSDFFRNLFKNYCEERNFDNLLEFEFETIARKQCFLSKNNNFQNLAYDNGIITSDNKINLKFTGTNAIKSQTPKFARDMLKSIFKLFVDHKNPLNIDLLVHYLNKIKKKFHIIDINNIAETVKVNKYNTYALSFFEKPNLCKLEKKSPRSVKGCVYYNHLLELNPHLKVKYKPIRQGSKVKIYDIPEEYSTLIDINTKEKITCFAYNIGDFPIEFAPLINRDFLFEKFVLAQVNRILESINLPKLNKHLAYNKVYKVIENKSKINEAY